MTIRNSQVFRSALYLTGFAFCIRFYRLGFHSLWLDEVVTVRDATHTFAEIPSVIASYPPLWAYFTRVFLIIFGHNDFWLRWPAALFGTITVPLICWVAKKYYGDRASFWAGLLMAVSVFDVLYSQELRMYTLLAFEALLSMYLWNYAIETRKRNYWFMYAIVTLLGLYTHNWFPFLVFSQGVWWLGMKVRDRVMDWGGIAAYLGIVVLYFPWIIVLKKQLALPVYGHLQKPGWMAVRETFYALTGIRVPSGESWVGVGTDARLPLLIISLGFVFLGLWFRDEKRSLAVRTFLVGCFLPVGIAFLISVVAKPIYLAGRYPILGLPAYILTAARGFQVFPFRWRRAAIFLGGIWVIASLFTLGRYYWFYEKSSWKKMCQWLASESPVSETLYLNPQAIYSTYFTEYYLHSRKVDARPVPEQANDKPIYLIIDESQKGQLLSMVPAHWRIQNEKHFGQLVTYKLQISRP